MDEPSEGSFGSAPNLIGAGSSVDEVILSAADQGVMADAAEE